MNLNLSFSRTALFLTLLLAGCSGHSTPQNTTQGTITPQSAGTPPATQSCTGSYYFYGQEKIPLTLAPQHVLIGFKGTPTTEQKLAVLRRFPIIAGFSAESGEEAASGFQVIDLKPQATCAQIPKLLKDLQQQELVLFANPVFNTLPSVGSGHRSMAVTPELMITLKAGQPESELQRLTSETGTKIADSLGENVYLLRATKEAKGDALEMANFFQQQPSVASAEPNFFLFGRTSAVQDK